jgi:hypothetical protein
MPTPTPGQDGYDPNVQGVPVNLIGGSLQVAIGEVALGAADPGLVALLAGIVGPVASAHTIADLYTLATSGSGFKIQGSISVSSVPTDSTLATALIGTNSKTFSDVVTAIGNLPQTQFNGAVTNAVLTAVEDQAVHYLAVRDSVLGGCITSNVVSVQTIAPTAPVSGSITEADTNAHRFAASATPCGSRVKIVADTGNNAAGVLIGGSTPAFPLYPGQSTDVAINDLHNLYYQFGYAGDKLYYIQSA